jgi:hypothetical protein
MLKRKTAFRRSGSCGPTAGKEQKSVIIEYNRRLRKVKEGADRGGTVSQSIFSNEVA